MSDPFLIDSPTCISFSGGRTSAYMLWRVLQAHNGGLPDGVVVRFANTGKEQEATLDFVRECGHRWGVAIGWVEYVPHDPGYRFVNHATASRNGEPFEALIRRKRYLPNPVARFCTSDLKVIPIEKSSPDDCDSMVGVRSDEPRRIAKMRARNLYLPLVDAGITRADVMQFWAKQEFDLALPSHSGITPLGNCDLCFLKGPNQIKSVIAQKPDRAIWWARMEKDVGGTFRSDRPSYAVMMKKTHDQDDWIGHDEEGIPCFCGE